MGSKYKKRVYGCLPLPQMHFMYLEPIERVWWLKMSLYFCLEANAIVSVYAVCYRVVTYY